MAIVILLVCLGIAAAVVWSAYGVRQERMRTVEVELKALGASPVRTGNAVIGSIGGMAVTYEVRPGGRNSVERTFCTTLVPAECPRLELELRPQTIAELRHVEGGRAIDLVLGHDAFDDAFIVEAAPAEVARAMLDQPIREALLSFLPCHLTVAAHELVFDKRGTIEQPGEVRRILELCVGAGARLAALSTELQRRQADLVSELGGMQGATLDRLSLLGAGRSAEAEIEALLAARARRRSWRQRQMAIAAVVVAVGVIAWAKLAGLP